MGAKPGGVRVAGGLAEIATASPRDLPRVSLPVLGRVPLFADLSDRHLRKVAKLVMPVHFDAGAAIVREGAQGHTFFVILEGRATVVRRGARPAKLRAGEYFGEMALLDRRPRSATVMAETAEEARGRGRDAELAPVDTVLDGDHEHLGHHAEAEPEHRQGDAGGGA